ncbi:MAG TPA: ROK family protein [Polyangiaceae bacterium]|jgi:glucokinase
MIGIDFGGTRIKAGLVDGASIVAAESVETHGSPDEVLDAIAALARKLDPKPQSVGVAIPGECDDAGRCYRLPNVHGFEGVPIAAELAERIGCPVGVENDATTAALGESLYGHGREHPSFVMVTLGTGIGGGVVTERRLHRGAHGFGGEIGHLPIDRAPNAPVCGCGLRGCVEAFAGTHALLARYRDLGGTCSEIRDIADAARRGDERAKRVFDEMGESLGWMLTAVQNTLDLDAIVFSGGVSKSFDLVEPSLRRLLRARAHAKPLGEIPLLVSALGDRAGIVGAAHLLQA